MAKIERYTQLVACLPIKFYQYVISPHIGPRCKFYPSCSEYAVLAIMNRGLIKGMGLILIRLLRCHPWANGGYDPVLSKKETI